MWAPKFPRRGVIRSKAVLPARFKQLLDFPRSQPTCRRFPLTPPNTRLKQPLPPPPKLPFKAPPQAPQNHPKNRVFARQTTNIPRGIFWKCTQNLNIYTAPKIPISCAQPQSQSARNSFPNSALFASALGTRQSSPPHSYLVARRSSLLPLPLNPPPGHRCPDHHPASAASSAQASCPEPPPYTPPTTPDAASRAQAATAACATAHPPAPPATCPVAETGS